MPALDGQAPGAREAPGASPSPRRARVPLNSTLLAGIGTLLLAMGVGVLIGRSGANTSARLPPAQVVTIAGGGGAAGATSTSTAPSTPPAAGATTAKPGGATGASGAAGGGSGGKSASKAHAPAPPKAVKVGSPGKGAGYQHGHFTGNFFGPEESG
jgi:hypothetical protein